MCKYNLAKNELYILLPKDFGTLITSSLLKKVKTTKFRELSVCDELTISNFMHRILCLI